MTFVSSHHTASIDRLNDRRNPLMPSCDGIAHEISDVILNGILLETICIQSRPEKASLAAGTGFFTRSVSVRTENRATHGSCTAYLSEEKNRSMHTFRLAVVDPARRTPSLSLWVLSLLRARTMERSDRTRSDYNLRGAKDARTRPQHAYYPFLHCGPFMRFVVSHHHTWKLTFRPHHHHHHSRAPAHHH